MSKVYTEKEQALDITQPFDFGPDIEAGWRDMVEKIEDEMMGHVSTPHYKAAERAKNQRARQFLETIALQPKAPFLLTTGQVKWHKNF